MLGEVPVLAVALCAHVQIEACNSSVRSQLKEKGIQDTPDACWQVRCALYCAELQAIASQDNCPSLRETQILSTYSLA